jgi:hypothetical protein
MAADRLEVQRVIEAAPAAIFAVLCDPQGHVAIDSSGMLMAAEGEPVAAASPDWKQAGIFPVISEAALRATLGILARTVARGYPRPAT